LSHTDISAEDRDFAPAFEKICKFATVHLFEWTKEIAHFDCPFEDSLYKLEEIAAGEDVREDDFLDKLYGTKSSMQNSAWFEGIIKKECNWIFNSKDVRHKVF
jgi:hypothetical protein